MQPERKIVRAIQDLVVKHGGRPFKIQGGDESLQEIGVPDLLICHHGYFVGMEVKQPGAKLRPAQRAALHDIFDAGGVAAVVESVGQAALILSILEKRGSGEIKHSQRRGICFDRGTFRSECKFK